MKKMKRLFSVLLVIVFAMGMMTTTFAASITAPDNGHTYEAYQIFTGTKDGNKLVDIKWGANAKDKTEGTAVEGAVVEELKAVENSTDYAKLEVIKKYVDLSSTAIAIPATDLADGYYLIKDKSGTVTGNKSETLYIVKVIGDLEIAPKGSEPTVEKTVQENSTQAWGDVADYNIGDEVPFQLKATLGDIDKYITYEITFKDTLSNGLKLAENPTFTVKVDNDTVDPTKVETKVNEDGTTSISINIKDVKALGATSGSVITVDYVATLTEDAVIGNPGNPNEVKLEYSNNPNNSGTPSEEPGNPPGNPPEEPDEPGVTPPDVVVVFTYTPVVNKVDADGNALKGAGFTIYKDGTAIGDEIKGEDITTFKFKGLDAGTYTIVETTVPEGYNKADDITFEIVPTYDKNDAGKEYISKLEVKMGDNVVSEGTNAVFTVGENKGTITTNVVNLTGSELPSTGGMGTTVFYILGSIMVIGAGILLVTKRRMAAK